MHIILCTYLRGVILANAAMTLFGQTHLLLSIGETDGPDFIKKSDIRY